MLPIRQISNNACRLAAAVLFASLAGAAWGIDESASPDTPIWRKVRADLFGERPIAEDAQGARIRLDVPGRAADAAVVPLSVKVRRLPGDAPPRKLYVVIDRNPSPIAAVFEFGEGSVEVETRVRIEEYSWVRVIAEGADGSLRATQRYVKAAGGCSAPAGKSLAERQAGMGQMKWRIDGPAADGSIPVQLMIRHPNDSGLAMDQLTRLYDPPHYVRSVLVLQGGKPVFAADVDFSISANPAFRFSVPPGQTGELQAEVIDSSDKRFESSTPIR